MEIILIKGGEDPFTVGSTMLYAEDPGLYMSGKSKLHPIMNAFIVLQCNGCDVSVNSLIACCFLWLPCYNGPQHGTVSKNRPLLP